MKRIRIFIIMVIFLFAGFTSSGQMSVSGTAYTEIVPLATVREEVQMNLGRFSVEDAGGSVTIQPDGTRLANGSVVLLEGSVSQGTFVVSGSENNSLNVVLPVTPLALYHQSSASTVFLENWTKSILKNDLGSVIINVGATLRLKSAVFNPSGTYTGKYQVNILYN